MKITKEAKKAFKKLEKMGVPVRESDPIHSDRGYFWIDAEDQDGGDWLDYYSNYWGDAGMVEVLTENGLYFEWSNPGFACVHKI